MNPQIQAILDRLEAWQAEMAEHRRKMRKLLERDDREWAIELEKYPTARQSLLEADKELADLLRSSEQAAEADERSSSIFLPRQSLGTDNGLQRLPGCM
ncbi:MAG: hypothetical protein DMG76_02335 [Acidobacteria bacterium]|jgi:hypothetical protein|nr:MAG: hypothetical protein DMG76_02335 [Acidobacteriota bacterium]